MTLKDGTSRLISARLLSLVAVCLLGTNAVQGQITAVFPSVAPSVIVETVLPASDAPTLAPTLETCVPVGGRCETDFDCCDYQEMFCSDSCKARFQDATKDETKLFKEDNPRGSLIRRALKGSQARRSS